MRGVNFLDQRQNVQAQVFTCGWPQPTPCKWEPRALTVGESLSYVLSWAGMLVRESGDLLILEYFLPLIKYFKAYW